MVKLLLLLAFVANLLFIVSATDTRRKCRPRDSSQSYCAPTSPSDSQSYSQSTSNSGSQSQYQSGSQYSSESDQITGTSSSSGSSSSSSGSTSGGNNNGGDCHRTPPTSCGGDPNAVSGCGGNCIRCSNYNTGPRACPASCRLGGCDCKSGYIFDDITNKCVLPKDCTPPSMKCTGPNEYYSCGGACDNVCATLDVQNQTNCPIINIKCNDMCYCESGYARDSNNICIPIENCPKPSTSCGGDPNAQSGCGQHCVRCSNYNKGPRACSDLCRLDGCDCKSGYIFDDITDKCVLPEDCAPTSNTKCNKPHEVYETNFNTCPPQTCESIGKICFCPRQPVNGTNAGCRCESGYYRNYLQDCISKENCLKCTGPNEYYSCGGACDNVCATLNEQNQTNCPIINIKCNEMCYCINGYARDSNNTCIPIKNCPKQCPGPNEYRDPCPPKCQPQTCDSIGKITHCPIQTAECQPACRCIKGYFRNSDGVCILEKDCPPPATCPEGEFNNTCPPIPCDAEYCPRTRYDPQICPSPKKCGKPRCTCGFNSHRDRTTGKCIATSSCAPFNCDGPNEEYDGCPPVCPGQNCSDYINNSTCSRFRIGIVVPCKPKCRCIKNFYRNSRGICVSGSQCKKEQITSCTSGPGETVTSTSAPPTGDTDCSTALQRLSSGLIKFSTRFLNDELERNPEQNAIMSTFSIDVLIAMMALIATGESSPQLLKLLNLKTVAEVRCAYKQVNEIYKTTDVTWKSNSIVDVSDLYVLSEDFKADAKNTLNAETGSINCSNPTEAAGEINEWAANNTNGLIKNVISPQSITPSTILILINAIYFKGAWKYPFDPDNTQNQDFFITDGNKVSVPTMMRRAQYRYGTSDMLNSSIIEMPYNGTEFSMVIVLPNDKQSIKNVVNALPLYLEDALHNLAITTVDLWMPKFTISSSYNLIPVLENSGLTAIFTPGTDLSGMLENKYKDMPLAVTGASQVARIIVNEVGAEAAAVTVISVGGAAATEPLEVIVFKINRPFVYFIKYNDTNIFSGVCMKPE